MDKSSPIDLLRITLPEEASADAVEWHAFDAGHTLINRGACSIAELPPCGELQWILPAAAVAGHLVEVPENTGRQQASVIDQALEDLLLCPREDAHVVPARKESGGRLVWVCGRQWLTEVLARWNEAGRHPDSAFAVYDLLPAGERTTLAKAGGSIIFRTANGQVGSLDDATLAQALLGPEAERIEDLPSRPLQEASVSLLTGVFAPRGQFRLNPANFRRSAWLAGALALALLLVAIGHWQQLERREKSLKEEIRQTFAAAFPGTPIVDPVMQWESKRREFSGDPAQRDALDHLSAFALKLADIQPRSAEYRDGTIRIVLTESDVARIRPRLEQSGHEFNFSPAESGFSRLDVRVKTK